VQSASAAHVRYVDTTDDRRLVFDLHSHAGGSAYFSQTDDVSDGSRPGPYIAVVVGHCEREVPELVARVVLPPYLVPITIEKLLLDGVLA